MEWMETSLEREFWILAGPGAAQRVFRVSPLAVAASWEDTQEKIQFLPGIPGFESVPEHTPLPSKPEHLPLI